MSNPEAGIVELKTDRSIHFRIESTQTMLLDANGKRTKEAGRVGEILRNGVAERQTTHQGREVLVIDHSLIHAVQRGPRHVEHLRLSHIEPNDSSR